MRKRWWYDVRCWVWWAHDKFGGCKQQDHGSFVLLSWWWCSCKIHQKERFIRTVFQSHQNGCKANGNQSGIDGPIPFVAEAIHRCDQSRFPRLTYYFAFFVSQFLCLLHLSYVARLAIVRNFADLWMTKRANDMATTRHSLHHFQHTALHPSIILLSHQRALVDFREKMQGWVSKDSPVLLRDRSVPRSEWCVF